MSWVEGISCSPMSSTCVIDWSAWGTWAGVIVGALGAAVALLSALATLAAVIVAFYVGMAPHKETVEAHRRRAGAIGLVVYARLTRQQLHLETAMGLCMQPTVSSQLFYLAKQNLVVDPAAINPLLEYFDAMDDGLPQVLAAAIADLEAAVPLLSMVDDPSLISAQAERTSRILRELTRSLRRARERLSPYARGEAAEDIESSVKHMVDSLIAWADSANDLQGGIA